MAGEMNLPDRFSKDECIGRFGNFLKKIQESYKFIEKDVEELSEKNPDLRSLEIVLMEEPSWENASKIAIGKNRSDPFFIVSGKNGEKDVSINTPEGLYDYLERSHYHFNSRLFFTLCEENFSRGVDYIIESVIYYKKNEIKRVLSAI
ncbi:MAG: hypothetical protein M1165_01370 [Candidatus Pacearchaeota archaeon]|jgi:hypothetical protein|nr:hypothetical protein [Candidatus Pacearchaeota archaeon]